jgi:putative sterol carrier protein
VVQYLSDEWFQRADEELSGDASLGAAAASTDLVIQYEVAGAPSGKVAYAVRIADGSAGVEPGPHPDAPVSFSLDYPTAARIASGELSAQAAFMRGDLKLGGDVTVLIRQHELLGALDDALAALRADTQF